MDPIPLLNMYKELREKVDKVHSDLETLNSKTDNVLSNLETLNNTSNISKNYLRDIFTGIDILLFWDTGIHPRREVLGDPISLSGTVDANSSVEHSVDLRDYRYYFDYCVISFKAIYSDGVNSGLKLYWLHSFDGSTHDSREDAERNGNYIELSYGSNTTRSFTFVLPVITPYVFFEVVNENSVGVEYEVKIYRIIDRLYITPSIP